MSFFFTILGHADNPLYTSTFGTSKSGGDGHARFAAATLRQCPFIAHAALDIVEEVQWGSGAMFLKTVDRHAGSCYVSAFVTGANVKMVVVAQALIQSAALGLAGAAGGGAAGAAAAAGGGGAGGGGGGAGGEGNTVAGSAVAAGGTRATRAFTNYNATSAESEEAMKKFFLDVYDAWLKTVMNPFYHPNNTITSPIFNARVLAAAKKNL